jgi:hypothetical protein
MCASAAGAGHVYTINVGAEQIVENLCTGRKAMRQGQKPEVFSINLTGSINRLRKKSGPG